MSTVIENHSLNRRAFIGTSAFLVASGLLYRVLKADDKNVPGAEPDIKRYEITEKITNPRSIDRNLYNAYFKVETGNSGTLYIVQKKDCRTDNVFELSYDPDEKRRGSLFPASNDTSKLVALVDATGASLGGVFKIYDKGDHYEVKYQISSIINVPSHTSVNSDFLLNVDETIRKMPDAMISDLVSRGVEVYLAKNIEDSFYHLYPSWKEYDREHPNDPKKPWLEITEDGCIDHRNYSNTNALYWQKRVIVPQTYYEYGTRVVTDRVDYTAWTRSTVGHELGHALDNFDGDDYYTGQYKQEYAEKKKSTLEWHSSSGDFKALFELDKQRMDPKLKKDVAYSWCKDNGSGQYEAFANIVAAFLHTMTKEDAKAILDAFPQSAEYIRTRFLPKFSVNLSLADVREKIHSKYLLANRRVGDEEIQKQAQAILSLMIDSKPGSLGKINFIAAEGNTAPRCCGR